MITEATQNGVIVRRSCLPALALALPLLPPFAAPTRLVLAAFGRRGGGTLPVGTALPAVDRLEECPGTLLCDFLGQFGAQGLVVGLDGLVSREE